MRRTQHERGLERGRQKDQVFLELIEARAPYEERRRALRSLEKQWVGEAKTNAERQQIRRGIAEDLATLAYSFHQPGAELGRCLRQVHRLGYSNLSMRVHVTCLEVLSLHLFPRRTREAWERLEDTERSVSRLRRDHPLRTEYLEAIAHARQAAPLPLPPPRRGKPSVRAAPGKRSPRRVPR